MDIVDTVDTADTADTVASWKVGEQGWQVRNDYIILQRKCTLQAVGF